MKTGYQAFKLERGPEGHDVIVELDPVEAEARVLDDNSLRRVAELAIATEAHHGCPQDVEWAIASGKAWLLQVDPSWLQATARQFERRHLPLELPGPKPRVVGLD